MYRHNGNQPGARSQLVIYPSERLVIAMIANITRAPLGFDEVQVVADPFFDPEQPDQPRPIDPVGEYELYGGENRSEAPDLVLTIWREFDGPYVASVDVSAEGRRMTLNSVHVRGSQVRAVGFSAQAAFDGQLVALEIDPEQGAGDLFSGGRRFPLSVERP